MPAFEARLRDFEAAGAQVVGISCDSIYSHDAWAKALGGISYPLLADIHRDQRPRFSGRGDAFRRRVRRTLPRWPLAGLRIERIG